jgi:hypothetical protein
MTPEFERLRVEFGIEFSTVLVKSAVSRFVEACQLGRGSCPGLVLAILRGSPCAQCWLEFRGDYKNMLLGTAAESDYGLQQGLEMSNARELFGSLKILLSSYKHTVCTEMHILLAIIQNQPKGAEDFFQPYVFKYRADNPHPNKYQEAFLKIAQAKGPKHVAVAVIEQWINETPFDVARIMQKLETYLSSDFYPYDQTQWNKFVEMEPVLQAAGVEKFGIIANSQRAFRCRQHAT